MGPSSIEFPKSEFPKSEFQKASTGGGNGLCPGIQAEPFFRRNVERFTVVLGWPE